MCIIAVVRSIDRYDMNGKKNGTKEQNNQSNKCLWIAFQLYLLYNLWNKKKQRNFYVYLLLIDNRKKFINLKVIHQPFAFFVC